MAKKIAQIQFKQQQHEQLENRKRQSGLNRTKFVRRAVDYYILQIRERGYKSTMIPLPSIRTGKAR